jgi:hypothetical protein
MLWTRTIACAAVIAAAGSAHGAFFSFASGSASNAWTFQGNGLGMTDGTGPNNPITLKIDDNNGPLPTLEFSTEFDANIALSYLGTIAGTIHNYSASGTFSFRDLATNITILTVAFNNAVFTAQGGTSSWGTAAGLHHGSGVGITMTWGGATLPGYGLAPGTLIDADFSFALSAMNTSGAIPYAGQNPGVGLTPNFAPTGEWFAEASFAAQGVIPAPGAGALLAIGGLAMFRRRR